MERNLQTLLLVILSLLVLCVRAQEPKKEDPYSKSSRLYDSLEKKAGGKKVTKDIFELVVRKNGRKERPVSAVIKSEDVFKPYEGYTIHSIVFKSVDMLEGSVIDTLQTATTKFGKFINRLHTDTRARIIKNNLLFKVGDKVDPYKIADNERVLREFITLRDARIYLKPSLVGRKMVDIVVVTQDVTPLGATGSYSSLKKFDFAVYDINMLGYARQLQLSYSRNSDDHPKNGFGIAIRETNFMHTFIQGELEYTHDYLHEKERIELGRDFFTPEIKYAGGVEFYRSQENFFTEDFETTKLAYTINYTDVWAGRSFEFKKRTNFIFSTRINDLHFTDRPYVASDSNFYFYNRTLFLGNVFLIKRNFLKGSRIQGFGKTEDVPVGWSVSMVGGKELSEFTDRTYLEFDGGISGYFSDIGYFNTSVAIGNFYANDDPQDGIFKIKNTYFSDLINIKEVQLRQFIYLNYTRGINRRVNRSVTVDGKWENSEGIPALGDQRMTLSVQTLYFMPWYFYGFQVALFHQVDVNLLSRNSKLLKKSALFPAFRAGIRTLNEYLVFPTFSFELIYYGKNPNFSSAWQFTFTTTLPNLFGSKQAFKPKITSFE